VIIYIISASLGDGGSQRVLVNYANYLSKIKKTKVSLISLGKKNEYESEILKKVNIIKFNESKSSLAFLSLVKFLLYKRPDKIISSQTHINFLTLLATKIIFFKKKNIFLREVNTILFSQHSFLKKKALIFLVKFFYSRHNIICPSQGLGKEFKKINNKINIKVIYFSIDEHDIIKKSNISNKTIDYFKNKNYILYFGRIQKHKGVIDLLKAYKLSKLSNIDLVFIGNGPAKKELIEHTIQYNLVKKVYFLDFLKNPFPFVKNSRLCVLPSYHEGLPNVMLQSIALNKNIISYDCNYGPSEILGKKSDLLVNVGNFKKLSEKIKYFSNKKKLYFNKRKILNKFENNRNLETLFEAINE
jgi:glycosyltransferase involved in cell wall biosynthesis